MKERIWIKKGYSKQYLESENIPNLKLYQGYGAFSTADLPWGVMITKLNGLRTDLQPNYNDLIEACYISGPIPGAKLPYVDQRMVNTPDVYIHATSNKNKANVYLDLARAGYVTTRDIKKGDEFIFHGSLSSINAMILHQANCLTPRGAMETKNFIINQSMIKNAGYGLFSKKNLLAGRLIGSYLGKIKDLKGKSGPYQFIVKGSKKQKGYIIDAQNIHDSSILRYINYGTIDKRNVVFEQINMFGIVAFTSKPIAIGEELFADYGPNNVIVPHNIL